MWINSSLMGSRCQSTIMALAAPARNIDIKDGVAAGLGKENPGNLLGIHLNGHRIVPGAVKNRGNLARKAHAARRILVELALTGLGCYDFNWHSSRFLWLGTGRLVSCQFSVTKPVQRCD